MAKKNKKAMVTHASKTLRNKRASKISKSLAGSVMAKSKYKKDTCQQPKQTKKSKKTKQKTTKKAMKKYIAAVEVTTGNMREQWADGRRENSLSSSGRWIDSKLYNRKSDAQAKANEIANGLTKPGTTVKPFIRSITWDKDAKEIYEK